MHLERHIEEDELDLAVKNEILSDRRKHLTGALAAVPSLEVRDLDEHELRRALLHGRIVPHGDLAAYLAMRPGLRSEGEDKPRHGHPSRDSTNVHRHDVYLLSQGYSQSAQVVLFASSR